MQTDLTTSILNDPRYQDLKARRSRFGWTLTLAMMVVYYGFILLVAFGKPLLSTRFGAGVTTNVPIAPQRQVGLLRVSVADVRCREQGGGHGDGLSERRMPAQGFAAGATAFAPPGNSWSTSSAIFTSPLMNLAMFAPPLKAS